MLATAFIFAVALKAQTVAPAPEGPPVVRVDLSRPLRQVTRCAAGAHWGLSTSGPPASLLAPLRPTTLRQPATLADENAGFGALDVRPAALAAGAHHIEAVLADLLPGYPYEWSGRDEWQRLVRLFAQRKVTAAADEVWYDVWDQPDWQPPAAWTADGGYHAFWKSTFELLREVDPQAVIVGPSRSAWSREALRETLTWMRDHACLPDVVSWHELTGASAIEGHVAEYRALERELGISERPISINEYMSQAELGAPGPLVAHLARLERARVGYACLAVGRDATTQASMGRLIENQRPLGGYWVARWYAELAGQVVSVTPGTATTDLPDAVASLAADRQTARILVAGETPRVIVYGFGAAPDLMREGRVHVTMERAPHAGFRPVPAPVVLDERDVEVHDQTIEISVPVSGWDAALLTLSAPSRAKTARRAPGARPTPSTRPAIEVSRRPRPRAVRTGGR